MRFLFYLCIAVSKQQDLYHFGDRFVSIFDCGIVHVSSLADHIESLVVSRPTFQFESTFEETSALVFVRTKCLSIIYDKQRDVLSFGDSLTGNLLDDYRHEITKNSISVSFEVKGGVYGGGQYQSDLFNFGQGAPHVLTQTNGEAAVPFWVGSKGFGIFWDQYGLTFANKPKLLIDLDCADAGELKGLLRPMSSAGLYFQIDLTGGDPYEYDPCDDVINPMIVLKVDGETIFEWIDSSNIPPFVTAKLDRSCSAQDSFEISLSYGNLKHVPKLFYKPFTDTFELTTLTQSRPISYWLFRGQNGSLDEVYKSYYQLTGNSKPLPDFAWGFWQSRERYHYESELLESARNFDDKRIPVSVIVQDWRYWGDLGWGPQWDAKLFPNPKAMIQSLHHKGVKFAVSTWSRYDKSTSFYRELAAQRLLIPDSDWVDPYSEEGKETFSRFAYDAHLSKGADVLWLDGTEPEGFPHRGKKTACPIGGGLGEECWLSYSLAVTTAISNRSPDTLMLTRSSFAGQQRTGAVLWSGDIKSSWESMKRQLTAALNYLMSGMHHWSMDIGGFFRPENQYEDVHYHELLRRWFQLGAFVPVFRTHGYNSTTEIWNFGKETEAALNSTITFRYQLLPYSVAEARVTPHLPIMRSMPLMFPHIDDTLSVKDQYFWGSKLLVVPALHSGAQTRFVKLPLNDCGWFDFWSQEEVLNDKIDVPLNRPGPGLIVSGFSVIGLAKDPVSVDSALSADYIELIVFPGKCITSESHVIIKGNLVTINVNSTSVEIGPVAEFVKTIKISIRSSERTFDVSYDGQPLVVDIRPQSLSHEMQSI